jgi:hypothetical protein
LVSVLDKLWLKVIAFLERPSDTWYIGIYILNKIMFLFLQYGVHLKIAHTTQDGSNKLILKISYSNFVLFCLQVGESTEANMQSYALERVCAAAHQKWSVFAHFEIVRIKDFNLQQ